MEFVAVFLVTLLIVGGLGLALYFGKPPTHRPSRQQILELLRGVENGTTQREAWDMFIGYPLSHDPELDRIRQQCVVLEEGDASHPPVTPGLGDYIYGKEGRARIHQLANELEKLIEKEPHYKEF